MEDTTLPDIVAMLEGILGTDVEKAVLDGLQEYITGRKADIEVTSRK